MNLLVGFLFFLEKFTGWLMLKLMKVTRSS